MSNFVERKKAIEATVLTALHVFISTLFFRCSSTLSRFPARAARKNEVFPSDCKTKRNKKKFLLNAYFQLLLFDDFILVRVLFIRVNRVSIKAKRHHEIVKIDFVDLKFTK